MNNRPPKYTVAIVGSGPAGLMVAHVVASAGHAVHLFEKRSGLGRKILVAGSSGLNISFDAPPKDFVKNYTGPGREWEKTLKRFSPKDWLKFVESLGLETFLGTSKRYFVKGMKGSSLLKAWVDALKAKGVEFHQNAEVLDFSSKPGSVSLKVGNETKEFSAVCFCLGGGSWEKIPPQWPEMFRAKNLKVHEFHSANSGFKVDWSAAFLKEAEGLPLKSVVFSSKKGSRAGELVITQYGLEGTPVYALGETGHCWIDLKPDLNLKELLKKFESSKENLSPLRRAKKYLNLSPAALALLYHCLPKNDLNDSRLFLERVKKFPIVLKERQSLEEAISSSGGVDWDELNSFLMLKRFPGVFLAGEMIDWVAPTGGFLIQGCVSLGHLAGEGIVEFLAPLIPSSPRNPQRSS